MSVKSVSRLVATLILGVGIGFGVQGWVGSSQAAQPFMESALGQLRAARASLDRATPDKAGHRTNAIGLIDQAIEQVRAGIAAAR